MTSRERVKAAIQWERPDRIPLHENFWTDTLAAWKKEGLPGSVNLYPPDSIEEHFDMDIAAMYIDSSPRFPQKILSREGDYYTYEDRWGYRATKPWQASGSIHYINTVTENRSIWEERVKPRMILEEDGSARIDNASYFEHFEAYPSWEGAKDKHDALRRKDRYILAFNYGPWEATWRHRDFSNCLMDIALDPAWFRDMIWTHHELTKAILLKTRAKGILLDGYMMVDDLGSSTATLISPEMFREILKPVYCDMGEFLRSLQIDFWLHSCGNVNGLIEDYLDAGLQVLNPLQRTAGMNAMDIAGAYKNRLAFFGNVDAHLLTGSWQSLERALDERCAFFRNGGWVFHSDHSIPPTMTYEGFKKMLEFVRNYEA